MVCKTQHPNAFLFFQPASTLCIVLHLLHVLTSIEFDGEFGFGAIKIKDISAYRVLTAEIRAVQLLAA